jgi:hypothetical protein
MGILAKIRPEPVREPLPPPKVYAPPSKADRSGAVRLETVEETMADRNPARALTVVKDIGGMCDFLENTAIKNVIEQAVPVSMPRAPGALGSIFPSGSGSERWAFGLLLMRSPREQV